MIDTKRTDVYDWIWMIKRGKRYDLDAAFYTSICDSRAEPYLSGDQVLQTRTAGQAFKRKQKIQGRDQRIDGDCPVCRDMADDRAVERYCLHAPPHGVLAAC